MKKNKGVHIEYGDVVVEAKGDFSPSASEKQFDTLNQLQLSNLNFPNYSNPCEEYQTLLDGRATFFPSRTKNIKNIKVGFLSEQISDENGYFSSENPIVLIFESEKLWTSSGLVLTFDVEKNIFATEFNIKWFLNEGNEDFELKNEDFTNDSAVCECVAPVENYNKIVITFNRINMPNNRVKLVSIEHGFGVILGANQIKNISVLQEINPISSELPISTARFDFIDNSNRDFKFLKKIPLKIFFNGNMKQKLFVDKVRRKSKNTWSIECEDYISLLENKTFRGGVYNDKYAIELLQDIFNASSESSIDVPFKIDDDFVGVKVSGRIPYTNCREALEQVAFAIGAVVITDGLEFVRVKKNDESVSQTIEPKRILTGQTLEEDAVVTGVEITYHNYYLPPISDGVKYEILYEGNEADKGQEMILIFDEPYGRIDTSNISYEVLDVNPNFVRFIPNTADCTIFGVKFVHLKTKKSKKDPVLTANNGDNMVRIEDATLVSSGNVDNVLNICYNYLVNNPTLRTKIVEGKTVTESESYKYGEIKYGAQKYGAKSPVIVQYDKAIGLGEKISFETEFFGKKVGRVVRQSYNLNGGIIIKDCVIK